MNKLIDTISAELKKLFDKWPGAKSHGMAELVTRDERTVPAVLRGGDYVYVGYDDRSPVISYHRLQSVNSTTATGSGIGREANDIINTYTIGLYVYMDRKVTGLSNTDMLLWIQANIPDFITQEPYTTKVIVRFTGAILNSQTVFGTEFQGGQVRMPPEKTMFVINYTLTTQFKKGCFAECPC